MVAHVAEKDGVVRTQLLFQLQAPLFIFGIEKLVRAQVVTRWREGNVLRCQAGFDLADAPLEKPEVRA